MQENPLLCLPMFRGAWTCMECMNSGRRQAGYSYFLAAVSTHTFRTVNFPHFPYFSEETELRCPKSFSAGIYFSLWINKKDRNAPNAYTLLPYRSQIRHLSEVPQDTHQPILDIPSCWVLRLMPARVACLCCRRRDRPEEEVTWNNSVVFLGF